MDVMRETIKTLSDEKETLVADAATRKNEIQIIEGENKTLIIELYHLFNYH